MGRRGPAPTPTKLKVLRGNPGKRKLPTNEPEPTPGAPSMPDWLSAEAKREWKRVVPELLKVGLLTVVDRAVLAAYCQAHAELVWATAEVERKGRIVEVPVVNRVGDVVGEKLREHPAVRMQRDAFGRVKQFLGEFGLSPSSRARLQSPTDAKPPEDDPLARLAAQFAARRAASGPAA